MVTGYTTHPPGDVDTQPVAIYQVDTVKRVALALTRVKTQISVNCAYGVGESTVTPAVGEQWYVNRVDGVWRLDHRIPFNDPTLAIQAVQGQVSVGGASGPLELNADPAQGINANAPVNLKTYTTAERPSASDAGAGATIFDTTLGKPVFSNGSTWVAESGDGVGLTSTDELPEGSTNKYYTDARAAAAVAASLTTINTSITTLTAGLAGKVDTSHTYGISDITGLTAALASKYTLPTSANEGLFLRDDDTWAKPVSLVDYGFCQSEIGTGFTGFAEADIRNVLQGLVDIGASWVRFSAWWTAIEPTTHGTYVWTYMDLCMNLCAEYGITPLALITNPAPTFYTPTVADYANLCAAIAARYGAAGTNQLHHYEIWNEVNHAAFTTPFASGATQYATTLAAAATAIRAADSKAFIISSGLASVNTVGSTDIKPSTFLTSLYAAGAAGHFDAVGFHWYSHDLGFTAWQEPTTSQDFYTELVACRAIMVTNGDSAKDIWVTEMGYPEPDVTSDRRGRWTSEQIERLAELDYIARWFLYNYRASAADITNIANRYGIVSFTSYIQTIPTWGRVHSINAIVPANASPGMARYAATIGNGSATSFNIFHNLDQQWVVVEVANASTGLRISPATVTFTSPTELVLTFSSAPATNAYRVNVFA